MGLGSAGCMRAHHERRTASMHIEHDGVPLLSHRSTSSVLEEVESSRRHGMRQQILHTHELRALDGDNAVGGQVAGLHPIASRLQLLRQDQIERGCWIGARVDEWKSAAWRLIRQLLEPLFHRPDHFCRHTSRKLQLLAVRCCQLWCMSRPAQRGGYVPIAMLRS